MNQYSFHIVLVLLNILVLVLVFSKRMEIILVFVLVNKIALLMTTQ